MQDRVAVVTGGDTGIGKAISIALAAEGAKVVVDYHGDRGPADGVVNGIAGAGGLAIAVSADVSNPQDVEALIGAAVERFGLVDIMVNNAGIEQKHPFLETPFDVFQNVLAVNLSGAWLCSQAAAKRMVHQKRGGRIINISSVHEEVSMPTNSPYCAAKGGLRMLARTIAVELAPYGITVNNICPGAVDTPMDRSLKEHPEEYEKLLSEIPLHRMAKPEEVAAMCVYLASEEAAYVTGGSFFIDGGLSKKSGSL
ncbi:MAG TPA: glucose 1-dehydrogenase [Candidatus Rubrimentiphilum sp.]|nr:glucose 1-dehydrogenase [Candidatus Rubrimentiphilum sp.]